MPFLLPHSYSQISLHLIVNECMQRRLIYRPESCHEYWRYFTYMLLHADAWHLSINMCLQVSYSIRHTPSNCRTSFYLIRVLFFSHFSDLLVLYWGLAGTGAGSLSCGPSLYCGRHLWGIGQCLVAAGAVVVGRLRGCLCDAVQSCAPPGFGQSTVSKSKLQPQFNMFPICFHFHFHFLYFIYFRTSHNCRIALCALL